MTCNFTRIFRLVSKDPATNCSGLMLPTEWVSGDVTAVAEWDFGTTDDLAYHKVWKQNQQHFSEFNDHAEWGNIVCTIFFKHMCFDSLLMTAVLLY